MPPSKKRKEEKYDQETGWLDIVEIDDGKCERVSFRVTTEEKEKIEKDIAKSNLKRSDYLRRAVLGKEIVVVDGLKELAREVNRIGNNINQLTKAVHGGRVIDTGSIEKLEEEYKKVFDEILKITKKV